MEAEAEHDGATLTALELAQRRSECLLECWPERGIAFGDAGELASGGGLCHGASEFGLVRRV